MCFFCRLLLIALCPFLVFTASTPEFETRTIKVVLLADEAFSRQANWQAEAEELVRAAASFFEEQTGLRFVVEQFATWELDPDLTTLEQIALSLEKGLVKQDDEVALGLLGRTLSAEHLFGFSQPQDGIVLVRILKEREMTRRALLHELAHLFGAVHVVDPDSLLDLWNRGTKLDSKNLALIQLFRDRLFVPYRFPLTPEKRNLARSIYQEIAATLEKEARRMALRGDMSLGRAANSPEDVFLNIALIELEERDYEAAVKACEQALRLNSDCLEALNLKGIARRRQGLVDEAIHLYRSILKKQPQNGRVYYNLGIALSKKGELEAALKAYEKALQIRPRMVEALTNQADVLLRLGREKEAETLLLRAVALDNRFPLAQANLAEVYFRQNKNEEAKEAIEKALSFDPNLPEAHNMLGKILHREGKIKEAMDEFTLALSLDSFQAKAAHNLGNCYLEMNQPETARQFFEQALRISPGLAEAHEGLGTCLLLLNDVVGAIRCFRQAKSLGLESVGLYLNLSTALLHQKKWSEAMAEARAAISIDAKSALAWNNLGICALQQQDAVAAERYFRQGLALDSRNSQLLANLANLVLISGRWDEAAALYETLLAVAPDDGAAHNNAAVAFYHLGNYEKAWFHLERALVLGAPVNPQFKEEVKKRIKD